MTLYNMAFFYVIKHKQFSSTDFGLCRVWPLINFREDVLQLEPGSTIPLLSPGAVAGIFGLLQSATGRCPCLGPGGWLDLRVRHGEPGSPVGFAMGFWGSLPIWRAMRSRECADQLTSTLTVLVETC